MIGAGAIAGVRASAIVECCWEGGDELFIAGILEATETASMFLAAGCGSVLGIDGAGIDGEGGVFSSSKFGSELRTVVNVAGSLMNGVGAAFGMEIFADFSSTLTADTAGSFFSSKEGSGRGAAGWFTLVAGATICALFTDSVVSRVLLAAGVIGSSTSWGGTSIVTGGSTFLGVSGVAAEDISPIRCSADGGGGSARVEPEGAVLVDGICEAS